MGATVTTGKLAAAFKTTKGNTLYVLFEEVYEKNCYPHTPRWSCYFIGSLEIAMQRIFSNASSCEGGMLQNRNGPITPEGYIQGWLKELEAPVDFQDRIITLTIGTDHACPVPKIAVEDITKVLSGLGRDDLASALNAGAPLALSLYDDGELLSKIYDGSPLSPWRIIGSHEAPKNGLRRADLGYTPTMPDKTSPIVIPSFLKIDKDNRLVQQDDGSWICEGWQYFVVEKHIRSLWEIELREPGGYRKRIQAFRNAISSAPLIPEGMKLVVDLSVPLDSSYERERVAELPTKIPVVTTTTGYEITLAQVDSNHVYGLTHLPEACTRWVLPDATVRSAPARLDSPQLTLLDV